MVPRLFPSSIGRAVGSVKPRLQIAESALRLVGMVESTVIWIGYFHYCRRDTIIANHLVVPLRYSSIAPQLRLKRTTT